jgi:hypothetical protein
MTMMKKWLMVGKAPGAVGEGARGRVGDGEGEGATGRGGDGARVGTSAVEAAGEGLAAGIAGVGDGVEGARGLDVRPTAGLGKALPAEDGAAGSRQDTSNTTRVNPGNAFAITRPPDPVGTTVCSRSLCFSMIILPSAA